MADKDPSEAVTEPRPVTAASLVTDNQRANPVTAASDVQAITAQALVSDTPAAAAGQPPGFFAPPANMPDANKPAAAPNPPSEPRWPSEISGDGVCQCDKCKTAGKNNDKRGRHHAKCPCGACQTYRGQTVTPTPAATAAPAGATGEPSFADLPGMAPAAGAAGDVPAVNYEIMAKMYFDMTTGGLTMVFGKEWEPQNAAERENVCVALKAYLAAKGVQDVSSGWLLAFVVIAYSAPRLRQPSTASKLQQIGGWCKDKILYPVFRFFKRRRAYSAPRLLEDDQQQQPKTDKP